ncbi:MAG: transcriptional repressor [Candidatus Thiodiazotropha sp.]
MLASRSRTIQAEPGPTVPSVAGFQPSDWVEETFSLPALANERFSIYTPMMNSKNDSATSQAVRINSLLSENGINLTRQRRIIADTLFARNQHVTADQLFDAVKQAGARVSKATVYNTLGLFVRKGLVREIFIDSSRTFYDSNTSHHHHFYNVDTGDLIDVKDRLAHHFINHELPEGTAMDTVDLVIRVRNSKPEASSS